jgi:hypothetical protein
MNIYCDLIEIVFDKAIYAIGSMCDDITGKIEIDVKTGDYRILRQPDVHRLYDRAIESLIGKHLVGMRQGNIPTNMCREVG